MNAPLAAYCSPSFRPETISTIVTPKTCGQCHPGANTRFTVGKVHVSPEAAQGAGAGWEMVK